MSENDFVEGTGENSVDVHSGRRRCDFVFECLIELLEDALDERDHRNCDFVFECLEELLEDVGEDQNNSKCRCRCRK